MGCDSECKVFTCCILFVTLLVYLVVAIEGVQPTEYAIIRDSISQDIN
jgi:hypothetical protein